MISEPELDDWWQSLPYKAKLALKKFVDGVEKGLKKAHAKKQKDEKCPYCGSKNLKKSRCGCRQCDEEPWNYQYQFNIVCQDCDKIVKSYHD